MKNSLSQQNSLRIVLLVFFITPLVFAGLELSWRMVRVATPSPDPTLSVRTIIDHEVFGDVVRYTYLGDQLPDTLVPEEVVGMRTETSYSRLVTLDDDTATVETISYPQQTFAQDLYGVWFYAEYATTTIEAFEERSALYQVRRGLARIFLPVVYAVTDTFFATAGDGQVRYGGSFDTEDFTTVRNAATGTSASPTATTAVSLVQCAYSDPCGFPEPCEQFAYAISRTFFPFNTGTILANAVISSASLNVYVTAKSTSLGGTHTVVQTTQPSNSTLGTADYDLVGSTEAIDSGERKNVTSVSTGAYTVFNLNSTGIGFIKRSGESSACGATAGYTCLGVRNYTNDFANSGPVCFGSTDTNSLTFSTSEATGTSQDPYLSVTYTVPAVEVKRYNVIWID